MLHAFYPKHIKISPSYSWKPEPSFTVKTIDWMHQTGPRILLSVTHMLYANQDCHGVGRCVKDGSCSSSSLSENQWIVLMGYLTNWTNVDAIKHITDDKFSFRKTAHCAWNTVQLQHCSRLIQHFSEKCDFCVSPFCHVVQKHKLFEVAYESILWLPTLHFCQKISKSVHVCQSYSKR